MLREHRAIASDRVGWRMTSPCQAVNDSDEHVEERALSRLAVVQRHEGTSQASRRVARIEL